MSLGCNLSLQFKGNAFRLDSHQRRVIRAHKIFFSPKNPAKKLSKTIRMLSYTRLVSKDWSCRCYTVREGRWEKDVTEKHTPSCSRIPCNAIVLQLFCSFIVALPQSFVSFRAGQVYEKRSAVLVPFVVVTTTLLVHRLHIEQGKRGELWKKNLLNLWNKTFEKTILNCQHNYNQSWAFPEN